MVRLLRARDGLGWLVYFNSFGDWKDACGDPHGSREGDCLPAPFLCRVLCRAVDEGEVVSIPPATVHLALAKCFCVRSRKMDAALSNGGAARSTCSPGQPSTSTSETLEEMRSDDSLGDDGL